GLDRGPEARGEGVLEAEREASALAVGEDARDEERRAIGVYAAPGARAFVGAEAERAPRAAPREGPVGIDELPEAHVGRAERHRRTVVVARLAQAVEPEAPEQLHRRLLPDEV